MPTYTPLQSIELASTSTSLVFSNIPQIYQDLVLVTNAGASGGIADLRLRLNGDTGQNYSQTIITGDGSTASSTRTTNTGRFTLNYWGALPSTIGQTAITITHIMNYSNNTTKKTCLNRANNAGSGTDAQVLLWNNTSAITSMEIHVTSNSLREGSTFDLYGISPVAANNAQAAGGTDIYYDSTYVYHVFKGSGTFTPYRNLTCDVLTIAGGGGGDRAGGGAGGLRYDASQSLTTNTNYTVTIGAGGVGATASVGTNGGNSQFGSLTAATGGGRAASSQSSTNTGASGGSGGGNEWAATGAGGSATSGQGNAGGSGSGGTPGVNEATAGGGGAGGVGGNGSTSTGGGAGGAGSSTYSSWGSATGTGQLVSSTYYYAGGGGSWGRGGVGAGGSGGGGAGSSSSTTSGTSGTTNTGGGGGGGIATNLQGGSGGSGIVIVRYAR